MNHNALPAPRQSAFSNFVIYDLETTGCSCRWHEITQIGAVRMTNGEILYNETFATFVKTERPIPAHITELTGITDAMVRNAPPPAQALRDFSRFAGRDAVLIAHNGRRFDSRFITSACQQHNIAETTLPCMDTLEISRSLWNAGEHNLDALARRLRIQPPTQHQRHDARTDVFILAGCFQLMLQKLTHKIAPFVTHHISLPNYEHNRNS